MKRNIRKNLFEKQITRNKNRNRSELIHQKNQMLLEKKITFTSKEEFFKEVQIGEVVFAKMPFTEKALEKIPASHRQRPYFVVGKTPTHLIAYASSHKMPSHKDEDYIFKIHKSLNRRYHRAGHILKSWTDSHYNLKKYYYIPLENIIELFQIPEYSDVQRLERQLVILQNAGKKVYAMNILFEIKEGDVVEMEGKYVYVYSSYKGEIYAHPISTTIDASNGAIEVLLNGESYALLTSEQIRLQAEHCRNLIFSAQKSEIEEINKLKKQVKITKKELKNQPQKWEHIRFLHDVGQVLQYQYGFESIIYLCTLGKIHYVISLDDWKKERNRNYKDCKHLSKNGGLNKEGRNYDLEDFESLLDLSEDSDWNDFILQAMQTKELQTQDYQLTPMIMHSELRDYYRKFSIDRDLMRSLVEYIEFSPVEMRVLLHRELRSDAQKLWDHILPEWESCEILLQYYCL